jgi:putative nucleotidyltransferase with HDIG domain
MLPRELEVEAIHQEVVRLDSLPTLPSVAIELIRRWNDPDLSIQSVVDLLSLDGPLSAKVLHVANASNPRLHQEVTSLRHASALLGLNKLRCLTLGVTVFQTFEDQKAAWAQSLDLSEFWRHSIAVATAAELLANRYGYEAPEEAFLAGLLHDIGKVGMLATRPEQYAEVLAKAKRGDKPLLEYEEMLLGVTHVEVGKWIGEQWNLPEKFRRAIWQHHQAPSSQPIGPKDPGSLDKLIYLADYLARRARIGESGNQYFANDETWLQRRYGIEQEDLNIFTSELVSRVQAVGQEFDLPVPTLNLYLKALEEANRQLVQRGMEAEDELEKTRERSEFLQTISSIAHLPAHAEIGADVLARAVDLMRAFLGLHWVLLVTTDTHRHTVQGVLYAKGMRGPQTFFRVLSVVDEEEKANSRRNTMDMLGETILTNGERVNLRDQVMHILQNGNLVAVPMSIDDTCTGECLVDAAGSRIHHTRHREYFGSLLDTISRLYERARLYRRIQRESETAAEALQREGEALRQLFHFERLASVGRLAAGAAHEINNPLAVISGKAQLLMMEEDDPGRKEAMNTIIDQSMRISKIISDLMGYARPAEPEVTDNYLTSMVENALYMAQHRLPNNEVEVEVEIPEEIKALRVDARQIEQVFVNLFVNAIQAMQGQGKLTIHAESIDAMDMVAIHVIDTGPGIAPDDLNRIFDPFFTTKREGEGTGLGLAVSHRIIESHGGRMTVNSRVGRGTTFTVQIPYDEGAIGEAEVVQIPKNKIPSPARRGGKKRILLVDDERQLSNLIRDFLQAAGYVVEQASDGVEALSFLESQVYDALVMDIRMPRKDGLEVLKELKGFTTGLPILMITGLASNEEIDQATKFGASRILRKPFQLDELLRSVDDITKSRNMNLD